MADRQVPIFALNTVLFPGGLLPLRVFEARYMDMTRDCLKHERPFGVCLIREGSEVGKPATTEAVGCLARIIQWDMQQLGLLQLQTRGEERFRILSSSANAQGLILAEVEMLAPEPERGVPAEFSLCAQFLRKVMENRDELIFAEPHRFDSAAWVGYRLAEILPLPLRAKQELLELDESPARLTILQRFLASQGLGRR